MTHGIARFFKTGVAAAAILRISHRPGQRVLRFLCRTSRLKLFNQASRVVLTRDGDQTAITMASDFEGDVKEFAVVVPVPTFIERKQIGVVDPKTIDHLDRYTAPRLVEYHDEDPCHPMVRMALSAVPGIPMPSAAQDTVRRSYGVTIEASYDVGEYDVLILSANESDGLVNWLTDNNYRIPEGAQDVLGSYIKQKMRFFVASESRSHEGLRERLSAVRCRCAIRARSSWCRCVLAPLTPRGRRIHRLCADEKAGGSKAPTTAQ